MTDREKTLERLRSANPLPGSDHIDADELGLFVSDFQGRRDAMADTRTMRRPEVDKAERRRIHPVLAFATALVVCLAMVGAAALLLRSEEASVQPAGSVTVVPSDGDDLSGGEDTAVEPTGPLTVFSWDGDDLSEWVTDAEMTIALEEVASLYDAADLDGRAIFDREGADASGDEAEWRAGGWTVLFHNGSHGGKYVGPPARTDVRLPQGATHEAEEGFGWGFYIFSGPNSDEMISIMLRPPGRSYGYPHEGEVANYKDMLFALASMMLQEMGWAD